MGSQAGHAGPRATLRTPLCCRILQMVRAGSPPVLVCWDGDRSVCARSDVCAVLRPLLPLLVRLLLLARSSAKTVGDLAPGVSLPLVVCSHSDVSISIARPNRKDELLRRIRTVAVGLSRTSYCWIPPSAHAHLLRKKYASLSCPRSHVAFLLWSVLALCEAGVVCSHTFHWQDSSLRRCCCLSGGGVVRLAIARRGCT